MMYTYDWDTSRKMWIVYWNGWAVGGFEKEEDAHSWCDMRNAREMR